MTYKILQLISSNNGIDYWTFVKVDSTSTTDFSSAILDEVETKLKDLLKEILISKLKIVSETGFTDDLIFES